MKRVIILTIMAWGVVVSMVINAGGSFWRVFGVILVFIIFTLGVALCKMEAMSDQEAKKWFPNVSDVMDGE